MHVLSSEHQCALPAVITFAGDSMEKFVCSCVSLKLYFLWFHPSLSASWASPQRPCVIQKCEQEVLSLTPSLPSQTHCIYCVITQRLSVFNDVTALLFEGMIGLFLDSRAERPVMKSPSPCNWSNTFKIRQVIFSASCVETWRIRLFCCCSLSLCSLNLFLCYVANKPSGAGFIRMTFLDSIFTLVKYLCYRPRSAASCHWSLIVFSAGVGLKLGVKLTLSLTILLIHVLGSSFFPLPLSISSCNPLPPSLWSLLSFLPSFPFFGCF